MFFDGKIKTVGKVDITLLKQLLPLIAEDMWEFDNRRIINSNFSESHTVWFREFFPTTDDGLHYFDKLASFKNNNITFAWATLTNQLEEIVNGKCVKSGVIRLFPGKKIERHVDGNTNIFKYCHRIVVPITSNNKDFLYYDDGNNIVLDEGIVYDSNGYLPHWVINNGTEILYTAVFDLFPNTDTHLTPIFHHDTKEERKKLKEISKVIAHKNQMLPNWEYYYNLEKERTSR